MTNPTPKWYIIHCYSGHENKVASAIKQRVEANNLKELIIDTLVPIQKKTTVKNGKKFDYEEKIFPGYVLVNMVLTDQTWAFIKGTEGITKFVGISQKPMPLSDKEVKAALDLAALKETVVETALSVGNAVKITDGAFKDMIGSINSINTQKNELEVLISVFGRETPIKLNFLQVARI